MKGVLATEKLVRLLFFHVIGDFLITGTWNKGFILFIKNSVIIS